MKPIRFGYCVPIFALPGGKLFRVPNAARLDPAAALTSAQAADALGFDSIWVADHLMLGRDEAILEGWTTLAAIAGITTRARLGIIHQGHFFRHPTVAAKMMATLDQLSNGRFILFADTGMQAREHHAYGLHYPDAAEARIAEFIEGLDLTLQLWRATPDQPLTFSGAHYHVTDAVCMPPPLQQPHPPIWFGEADPQTLEACARMGQGWNSTPVDLNELQRRLAGLMAACKKVGRAFSSLDISYETQVLIAPTRDGIRQQLRAMLALTPDGVEPPTDRDFHAFVDGSSDDYPRYLTDAWLVGTPDEISAQIRRYQTLHVRHFLLWFMDAPHTDGMKLFMEQVAPRFGER